MLNAGLNYLENLNISTIQLEELDKVRCIGLAQNENVVLAHFLRNQQLEKDISNLKEKSSNEVNTTIEDNKNLLSEIQTILKKNKQIENMNYLKSRSHKDSEESFEQSYSTETSDNKENKSFTYIESKIVPAESDTISESNIESLASSHTIEEGINERQTISIRNSSLIDLKNQEQSYKDNRKLKSNGNLIN